MFTFLPAPLVGVVVALALLINMLMWMAPVYTLILVKLLTWGRARDRVSCWIADLAQQWAAINVWIWDRFLAIEWDLRGIQDLDRRGQYLMVANHSSWNDIPVLMKTFDRRAPFFKFFIKQELIWVPILGLAWWGLDYPFMKRYSAARVARNPKLRGKDLEATRRACTRYRSQPVTILNFLEGTRFTQVKRAQQESPYRHLLRPRSGGFAFVLSALGPQLHSMLDVTIVYPDGDPGGLWDLLCGRIRRVVVDVRQVEIPEAFFSGDYADDQAFREELQAWVASLWAEKDARIEALLSEQEAASER